jgi:hypothetical protein
MRRIFLIALIGGCCLRLSGQIQPLEAKSPELLPPSPDAAALIKVGMGSLNKSTGAVNATIPLYDLKVRSLTWPVNISYASQGNKVEEASSRVGMGWSLMAGGVITRSSLGKPDEMQTRASIPSDMSLNTQSNYDYFASASNTNPTFFYDTQPDEFRFSFGAYSGKFVFDASWNPIIISHANLKIVAHRSFQSLDSITITTPDGVKYTFGGRDASADHLRETTVSSNLYHASGIKTSFFLSRLQFPSGETIYFNYTALTIKANTGLNENLRWASGSSGCGSCQPMNTISHNLTYQYVVYNTFYLSNISAANGITIDFRYVTRNDASGDLRLQGIDVFHSRSGKITEFGFEYHNLTVPTNAPAGYLTTNSRFLLTKLVQYDNQPEGVPGRQQLNYLLEYYDMNNVVSNVFAQDHYGFANSSNNSTLLPHFDEYPSWPDADRRPSWVSARTGVLKKISYPTGGSEEFHYEANTLAGTEVIDTYKEFIVSGAGVSTTHFDYSTVRTPFTKNITPVRSEQVSIELKTFIDPLYSGTTHVPDNLTKVAFFKIRNLTTNTIIATSELKGIQQITSTANFVAGNNYRVELEVRGPTYIFAHAIVKYNSSATDVILDVNKEACGIRVSRIVSTDSVTGKKVSKYFHYASLSSLNKSSGVGQLTRGYGSNLEIVTPNQVNCYIPCTYRAMDSDGAQNLFVFDNSHFYYRTVIETDNLDFSNGGTEYWFNPPNSGSAGLVVRGSLYPGIPTHSMVNLNGMVDSIRVFDKDFKIHEVTSNVYTIATTSASLPAISVKRNYTIGFTSPGGTEDFHQFDVIQYLHSPGWIQNVSKTVKSFDGANQTMISTETYGYGNAINTAIKSLSTTNSKGQSIVLNKKYPTDFAGIAVFDKMIAANNIKPVVEETI